MFEIIGISSIVAIIVSFIFDVIMKRIETKYQKMFSVYADTIPDMRFLSFLKMFLYRH